MQYEDPFVKFDPLEAETSGINEFHILDAAEVLRVLAEQSAKCQRQVDEMNVQTFGTAQPRPEGKSQYFSPRGARLVRISHELQALLGDVIEGRHASE
jgi:hypothetical protein